MTKTLKSETSSEASVCLIAAVTVLQFNLLPVTGFIGFLFLLTSASAMAFTLSHEAFRR